MNSSKQYDVAISYASEDRAYADELAGALSQRNVDVFYDPYEKADMYGKDLPTHLVEVYRKARYCVILASKNYSNKAWCNLERKAAQATAVSENRDSILPVQLDKTEIAGILPSTVNFAWPPESAETLADFILVKLDKATTMTLNIPKRGLDIYLTDEIIGYGINEEGHYKEVGGRYSLIIPKDRMKSGSEFKHFVSAKLEEVSEVREVLRKSNYRVTGEGDDHPTDPNRKRIWFLLKGYPSTEGRSIEYTNNKWPAVR